MRKSRVLLAGVAVAAAAVTTSAFTNSNTSTGLDNNIAGYGQLDVSGVNVSNVAYTPGSVAGELHSVKFTVDKDGTAGNGLAATMSFAFGASPVTTTSVCTPASAAGVYTIDCVLSPDIAFSAFNKTALTVTSN
jgi:hypothetical protein